MAPKKTTNASKGFTARKSSGKAIGNSRKEPTQTKLAKFDHGGTRVRQPVRTSSSSATNTKRQASILELLSQKGSISHVTLRGDKETTDACQSGPRKKRKTLSPQRPTIPVPEDDDGDDIILSQGTSWSQAREAREQSRLQSQGLDCQETVDPNPSISKQLMHASVPAHDTFYKPQLKAPPESRTPIPSGNSDTKLEDLSWKEDLTANVDLASRPVLKSELGFSARSKVDSSQWWEIEDSQLSSTQYSSNSRCSLGGNANAVMEDDSRTSEQRGKALSLVPEKALELKPLAAKTETSISSPDASVPLTVEALNDKKSLEGVIDSTSTVVVDVGNDKNIEDARETDSQYSQSLEREDSFQELVPLSQINRQCMESKAKKSEKCHSPTSEKDEQCDVEEFDIPSSFFRKLDTQRPNDNSHLTFIPAQSDSLEPHSTDVQTPVDAKRHPNAPQLSETYREADTHLQTQAKRVQFRNTPLEHSPQKYTPVEVASTQLMPDSGASSSVNILHSTDCLSDSGNEDDDHVDSIPETQLPRFSQSSQIHFEENPSTQYLSFNPIALEREGRRDREATPEFLRRPVIPTHLFTQALPTQDIDEEDDPYGEEIEVAATQFKIPFPKISSSSLGSETQAVTLSQLLPDSLSESLPMPPSFTQCSSGIMEETQ